MAAKRTRPKKKAGKRARPARQIYLAEHMDRLEKSVLAQAQRARKGSEHSGLKGSAIEAVLRRILPDYVPQTFTIGTGQIAASDGTVSPQMDILIYDSQTFPRLAVNEDGSVVVCCESVSTVIECKATLNLDEVEANLTGLRKIDAKRYGLFGPLRAGYFVLALDAAVNVDIKRLRDRERDIGVSILDGGRSWYQPRPRKGKHAKFATETGNAFERCLSHVLSDCMKKGVAELGDLTETYAAVAAYFGWK